MKYVIIGLLVCILIGCAQETPPVEEIDAQETLDDLEALDTTSLDELDDLEADLDELENLEIS